MIWQWLVFLTSVGVLLVLLGLALLDVLPESGWIEALAIVAALGVLFGLVTGGVISVSRHYNRVSCRSFAVQTNRLTKFAIYNSWNLGDCLTPDGHGRWIPTRNLREFGSTS